MKKDRKGLSLITLAVFTTLIIILSTLIIMLLTEAINNDKNHIKNNTTGIEDAFSGI